MLQRMFFFVFMTLAFLFGVARAIGMLCANVLPRPVGRVARRLFGLAGPQAVGAALALLCLVTLSGCSVPAGASNAFWNTVMQYGPWLVGVSIAWLGVRLNAYIKAHVHNAWLSGVLTRLDDVVMSVVSELANTTVDKLKAGSKDGKLPLDAAAQVKKQALDMVKSYMGAKGLALLEKVLGFGGTQLDAYLGTKVEAAVAKQPSKLMLGSLVEKK